MSKVRGVSGLVLLPARDYEWELVGRHSIRIPRQGKISDILNEQELASGVKIAGDDEFSVFEDNVMLLWEVVRVMFARSQYPSLEDDQCFNVVALEVSDDSIVVHGEVIRALMES